MACLIIKYLCFSVCECNLSHCASQYGYSDSEFVSRRPGFWDTQFCKLNQVILLLIWNQHNIVKKANLVIVGHPDQRIGSGSCQATKHVMQIVGDSTLSILSKKQISRDLKLHWLAILGNTNIVTVICKWGICIEGNASLPSLEKGRAHCSHPSPCSRCA